MSMIKKSILLVVWMFLESPALGMVYSWTDSSGIKHYVNREYEIPARYRARAKALYPEPSDPLVSQQNNEKIPETQLQSKPEGPQKAARPVVAPAKKRKRKVIAVERKSVGRHLHPRSSSGSEEE